MVLPAGMHVNYPNMIGYLNPTNIALRVDADVNMKISPRIDFFVAQAHESGP